MSGGSFDYAYIRIAQFADELRNKLQEQGKDTQGYGYPNPRWTTDVACKLATVAALADHVALLAKEAEWLYSGDTGEDTFTQRVRDIEVTRDRACAAEIDRLRAALGRIEQAQALGTAHAVAGLALRGIVDDRPATSVGRAGCGFPYCGGDSPECATCGNKA